MRVGLSTRPETKLGNRFIQNLVSSEAYTGTYAASGHIPRVFRNRHSEALETKAYYHQSLAYPVALVHARTRTQRKLSAHLKKFVLFLMAQLPHVSALCQLYGYIYQVLIITIRPATTLTQLPQLRQKGKLHVDWKNK